MLDGSNKTPSNIANATHLPANQSLFNHGKEKQRNKNVPISVHVLRAVFCCMLQIKVGGMTNRWLATADRIRMTAEACVERLGVKTKPHLTNLIRLWLAMVSRKLNF